jgi:ABC-type nitrate/sulfonate/bicarbonate transport system substrate-binding protein
MSDRVVVVGSFTPSVVLDLAASTGRLDAAGVLVEEVPVQSSPGQFRSLLDDEIQVALTSPDNVLAYRYNPANPLGGLADVRMVAAVDRGMGLGLYGRPGLTAADLRGARVGVDVPASGFALALYALAESLGVGRDDYEIVTLGSTPQRLRALLAGECDATMLNAGNELAGEAAGCVRLAGATDVCSPYLGVVVAVAGDTHLDVARRISEAVTAVAGQIVGGGLTDEAAASAARRLGLDDTTALRYVDRLRDPAEGLVPDGVVDPAALRTLVDLRRRYLPTPAPDGSGDLLDRALDDPGLVATGA